MTDHKLTIDKYGSVDYYLRGIDGTAAVTVYRPALGFDLGPEALRDWIESQRPQPRFTVKPDPGAVSGEAEWTVVDRGELTIAVCETRTDAEQIAAALNAQEEKNND